MVFSQATSKNGRVAITMTDARPMCLELYLQLHGQRPKAAAQFFASQGDPFGFLVGIKGQNDLRFTIHTNVKTSADLAWLIINRGKKAFQSVLICV